MQIQVFSWVIVIETGWSSHKVVYAYKYSASVASQLMLNTYIFQLSETPPLKLRDGQLHFLQIYIAFVDQSKF